MSDEQGISRRTFIARGAATGGAVLMAGAAGSALAACGSSGSGSTSTTAGGKPGVGTGTPVPGGSLSIGLMAEIDGFYPPNNHWDTNGYIYANCLYDPLMAIAANGTIQPYLAQSLSANSTYDTWTLTLRPGVKFHDGSDLTATVVVNNYNALRASLLTGQALTQITSVTATDPMTVVYKLEASNQGFPAGLATQVGYVVGQAMIDQAKANVANPTPIGTGPFVFKEWQPNNHFTGTKNPNYWRKGLPYLDQITLKPIPDTIQREATLKTGGVDMIGSSDTGTIQRFQGASGYELVDSATNVIGEPSMAFIMLNCVTAPTNDIRIRQALAKATDQAQVQKIFSPGFTRPVNGLFLQGSPYYSETGFPTYDLAGAKQLVAEYKAQHGAPTVNLLTVTDPRLAQVVQVIQQMWQEAGFTVTISQIEQAQLINDFVAGTFQTATVYQFGAVDPDLNYVWWSTTTAGPIGSIALNFPRNSDPVIEQAMLTGRHALDQATRVASYKKVNEQLAKDLPYIWLEQYIFSEVAATRVQNWSNPILPNGMPGYAFDEGIFNPVAIWMSK